MSSQDSSSSVPYSNQASKVAPTPVNTPLNPAPIAQGLSRPTVEDIPEGEDGDDDDDDVDEAAEALGALGVDGPSKQAINLMMQHKLSNLIGKSSGYIERLPVPVKRRVEGLKGISVEYDKLLKQHKKEIYQLEQKFLKNVTPLRKRRADVINGAIEPTAEEIAAGEAVTREDDPDAEPLPAADAAGSSTAEKGIPEFWLTALKNHIAFSELITERDEGALRHLVDVTLEYLEGEQSGFKIVFHFSSNDYFENSTLVKEYRYKDELDVEGDYLYERAVGYKIDWKEDQNLTQEIVVKRQRNKATNRTRVIRRSKPTESFFNFFTPPEPIPEDEDEDDMDDEELEERAENLEMDYQLGQDLKDRVIPRAIDYFTGKALDWEEDEDDDYDDEDYGSDEDDEDDDDELGEDDEDDDDDDRYVKRGKAARRAGAGKSGAEKVDPQECKSQ